MRNSLLTLFACLLLFSCRPKYLTEESIPTIDNVANDILNEVNEHYKMSFIMVDSTTIEGMGWSGMVPDIVGSTIGIDTFFELVDSFDRNNKSSFPLKKFHDGPSTIQSPYLILSNFGLSKNKKYMMIYVAVVLDELSGHGDLKVFEIVNGRIVFPAVMVINLWVS